MQWFRHWKTTIFDMTTGQPAKIPNNEVSELINMYPNSKRELKSLYFKTFRGMISQLKLVNKNCKKYNSKVEIRFQLPIKW